MLNDDGRRQKIEGERGSEGEGEGAGEGGEGEKGEEEEGEEGEEGEKEGEEEGEEKPNRRLYLETMEDILRAQKDPTVLEES
jgi:hypothetical protein